MEQALTLVRTNQSLVKAVLSLALFSVFSVLLVAFRMNYTDSIVYVFLIWNLFLAWVPLFAAVGIYLMRKRSKQLWPLMGLLGILWFLFYPNSPYMVTDLVHLKPRVGMPFWFDQVMLTSYIISGLLVGFLSLMIVHKVLKRFIGGLASWGFAAVMSFLTGLGIYMGRYMRFNSWDVWNDAQGMLYSVGGHLVDPGMHPRTYGVTLLFGFFLFLSYIIFVNLVNLRLED